MKKLIAIFSLLVLMVPVFALNAGVTTSDILKEYPGEVSVQTKGLLTHVVDSLNEVVNALEHGYKLTGPEEFNQYGTMIREWLEKDYAALFAEDEILASYVYLTMIRPVSQDIECEVAPSKTVLVSAGQKIQAKASSTLRDALKRAQSAQKVIDNLDGQDDMICQFIMTTMADPLKKMSANEATIEAAVYGRMIKVHGIPLAKYIEQQALRLNWPNDLLDEFEGFGKFVEDPIANKIESK
ncbi:MAG: hypothetical protein J5601_05350 [Elusimicrobiaceae bacterium]|nr:hypothetical protein [Elusimicrobiaceae bacterium]